MDTLLYSAQAWNHSEHHFYAAIDLLLAVFGLTARFPTNDVALASHPQPKIIPRPHTEHPLTIPDFGLFMTFLQDKAVHYTDADYKLLKPLSLWEIKPLIILDWFQALQPDEDDFLTVADLEDFSKHLRQTSTQALETFRNFPIRELRVWLLIGIGFCVLKYKRPPLDRAQNLPVTKASTKPSQPAGEGPPESLPSQPVEPKGTQGPETPAPSRKQPPRTVKDTRKPSKRKRRANDEGDEEGKVEQASDEELLKIEVADWAAYLEPPQVEYFAERIFLREEGILSFNPLFCQAMCEMLDGRGVVVQPSFFDVPDNVQPTQTPGNLVRAFPSLICSLDL